MGSTHLYNDSAADRSTRWKGQVDDAPSKPTSKYASIWLSLRWIAEAHAYAFLEPILKKRIHNIPMLLPAAWEFYRQFQGVPGYQDDFSHLAANSRDTAWIAEAIVGDERVYRLRLNISVRVNLLHVYQSGAAEYAITEGTRKGTGTFQVEPRGFQAQIGAEEWVHVSNDFAHAGTVDRAIMQVRAMRSDKWRVAASAACGMVGEPSHAFDR